MPPTLTAVVAIALLVLGLVLASVTRVPEHKVGLVERLGRAHRSLPAGWHFIFPVIDRVAHTMSLDDKAIHFSNEPLILRDSEVVRVDATLQYAISDPVRAAYEIADHEAGARQLVQVTMRNRAGELSLDDFSSSIYSIAAEVESTLREPFERWGLRLRRFEISHVHPYVPSNTESQPN